MAKRITMQQRLVAFGLEAVGLELDAAIETLQAIRNSRFPKTTNSAKPRKPRSDAGKSRKSTPTPTQSVERVVAASSSATEQ